MNVLAIDTSDDVGSVAIVAAGALVAEIAARVRAQHGEVLLPHVERVLELASVRPKDLNLLAIGLGPGSFTGTRIGVATAKGLALALGIPVVGVSSLRVLARGAVPGTGLAVPLVDAHRGELFAAAYLFRAGEVSEEILAPYHDVPHAALARVREAIGDATPTVCGNAVRRHGDVVREHLGSFVAASAVHDSPRASLLALEATVTLERHGASDLATLEPMYLRPSDAKLPNRPLRID